MLADIRRDYTKGYLDIADVDPDPFAQFEAWFQDARAAGDIEPNAMTLATVSADGAPSARVVLLKGLDKEGFRFYTNYLSRKGEEMAGNRKVALCFWWAPVERQVRIEGVVEQLPLEESEAYFRSRPKGSQVGASVSPQSRVLADRQDLDQAFADALVAYEEAEVPFPDGRWGGYLVRPAVIEFWQGRRSRLHDRIRYRRDADGAWVIERLAP
jgi:pyridoxamine 5'-phosphate oxidase